MVYGYGCCSYCRNRPQWPISQDDRFVAIGATEDDPRSLWVTEDGRRWDRQEERFRYPRNPLRISGGELFTIIGALSDANGSTSYYDPESAVWVSYDGLDWSLIPPPTTSNNRSFGPAVAHDETVLLFSQEFADGSEDDGQSVVWIGTVDQ